MWKQTCLISTAYSKWISVSKPNDIYQLYVHSCVPLWLAKSEAIMNSPSKAKLFATTSEDINNVPHVSDHVSVFVSWSMDMYWYGVWIRQHVTCLLKSHKSTFSVTGGNVETISRSSIPTYCRVYCFGQTLSCTDAMLLLINLICGKDTNM